MVLVAAVAVLAPKLRNGETDKYLDTALQEIARRSNIDPAALEAYYASLARDFGVPLGRVAEAEEVGDLVAFLVSARAAYLTGAAINFDGGMCAVL